jgi:hypothetical protein
MLAGENALNGTPPSGFVRIKFDEGCRFEAQVAEREKNPLLL